MCTSGHVLSGAGQVSFVWEQVDLGEWAIAVHGMYKSHQFNWFLCKIPQEIIIIIGMSAMGNS